MDGFELYEQIKKMDGKIKVVFVTASEVNYEILREVFPPPNVELNYDEDIIAILGDSTEEQGVRFIGKPVAVNEFIRRVNKELQEQRR